MLGGRLLLSRTAKVPAKPEQRPFHEDVEQQTERHDNAGCDNDEQ